MRGSAGRTTNARLFWGILLVLVGVLLTLNSLGILDVNIWGLVWPLFLIFLGVWILWGFFFARPSWEAEEVSIPLDGASRARVHVKHGAGRLQVDGSAGLGELVDGTFGGGLDHRVSREGDTLDARMRLPVGTFPNFAFPWAWGPAQTLDWTFGLSTEIPLSLEIETGAGEAWLDLSDLSVTDLRLQTGASATDLTLPVSAGYTRVKISAGAASVKVRVPSGVAARIRVSGALAGITVDRGRFPREGGVYQSPDYDTAPDKVDVEIDTGVGSIEVL